MAGVDSFEDLECYKTARGFRVEVSRLSKQFPRDQRFRLTDQTLRQQWNTTKALSSGYVRYLESITSKDRRFTEWK